VGPRKDSTRKNPYWARKSGGPISPSPTTYGKGRKKEREDYYVTKK